MGKYAGFFALTEHALRVAMMEEEFHKQEFITKFMSCYANIDVFEDVEEHLIEMRSAGITPVILTNGERSFVEQALSNSKISSLVGEIISVESVKVFKPHPNVYQYAAEHCLVRGFVSSNPWDVTGASAYGFPSFWLNRSKRVFDGLAAADDYQTIRNLSELTFFVQNS